LTCQLGHQGSAIDIYFITMKVTDTALTPEYS
jgi:hypothetical protein